MPGNKGQLDIVVFKVDANLSIVWAKNYGGSLPEKSFGLTVTADGGFVAVGEASSNDGDVSGNHGTGNATSDAWVLKLDKNGAVQWQKCLGGTSYEDFMGVVATSDGGYMLSGETYSNNGDVTSVRGSSDFWVAQIDGTGKLVWQKTLGSTSSDESLCLISTADGGFVSAGYAGAVDGDVSGTGGGAWMIEIK